ncbi:MAG: hypothetical protein JO353_07555, partial [Phycisphaerae bacterium]|nr:hypothetical protein [Phycisphaerae bacterium]
EYWRAVGEVPSLSLMDRLRSRLWIGLWMTLNWHKLVRDLALAIESAITNHAAIDIERFGVPDHKNGSLARG